MPSHTLVLLVSNSVYHQCIYSAYNAYSAYSTVHTQCRASARDQPEALRLHRSQAQDPDTDLKLQLLANLASDTNQCHEQQV